VEWRALREERAAWKELRGARSEKRAARSELLPHCAANWQLLPLAARTQRAAAAVDSSSRRQNEFGKTRALGRRRHAASSQAPLTVCKVRLKPEAT